MATKAAGVRLRGDPPPLLHPARSSRSRWPASTAQWLGWMGPGTPGIADCLGQGGGLHMWQACTGKRHRGHVPIGRSCSVWFRDLRPGEAVVAERIDRLSRLPLEEAEALVASIRPRARAWPSPAWWICPTWQERPKVWPRSFGSHADHVAAAGIADGPRGLRG